MIKTKVDFLEGRLFSSQSEIFENFLNCFDWLDKSRPSKKPPLYLLIMLTGYISLFLHLKIPWGNSRVNETNNLCS